MKLTTAIAFAVVLAAAMLINCSDDEVLVNPEQDDGKVTVTGVVLSFRCSVGDIANNSQAYPRYTEITGKQAAVLFIGADDQMYTAVTDDSSSFTIDLDTGTYTITVECWHAWPDRFYDVTIAGDTIIDLPIVYDYLDPDSIDLFIPYEDAADTLGEATERQYLQQLNTMIEGPLELDESTRVVFIGYYYPVVSHYTIPVRSGSYVWEVVDRVNQVVRLRPVFPENLEASTEGYPCLCR